MNIMSMMGLGATGAIIFSMWNQIKSVFWRIANLFIQQVTLENDWLQEITIEYLLKNFKHSKNYDQVFSAEMAYSKNKMAMVVFEKYGKHNLVFWNKYFPLLYGNKSIKIQDKEKQIITITYIRGTLDVSQLFKNAAKLNEEKYTNNISSNSKRHFIKYLPSLDKTEQQGYFVTLPWYAKSGYRLVNYQPNDLSPNFNKNNSLEQLFFPEKINKLIQEIKTWINNKEWYEQKRIPWKRGWLVYGVPGTGKTALARAFAEDLDLPLFTFNLAEMDNNSFVNYWRSMQQSTPCIALLEDFDNVFHGRNNISKTNTIKQTKDNVTTYHENNLLSFETLINCLDGVEKSEGVFTIITTNDISKIDEAIGVPTKINDSTDFISTRPGRIDKAICLSYLTNENKIAMANKILQEFPEELNAMLQHIKTNKNQETPAQFQEKCTTIALEAFWKQKQNNELIKFELNKDELNKIMLAECQDKTPPEKKIIFDKTFVNGESKITFGRVTHASIFQHNTPDSK